MNNDRELLELAAKAAVIEYKEYHVLGLYTPKRPAAYWNPLTDDGDALRLAVKLKMDVVYSDTFVAVKADIDCEAMLEDVYADPYAATRRAIVRAAAEIGKGFDV